MFGRASLSLTLALGSFALLGSTAHASGIRIITQAGGPSFSTIQAAVNAASEGDVILLGTGNYASFAIDNKSLWILSLPNAETHITGLVTVQNLAARKVVFLGGLGRSDSTLSLVNNLGQVRLQWCQFGSALGAPVSNCPGFPLTPSPAVTITNSNHVSLFGCTILGAHGQDGATSTQLGGNGQRALSITGSDVAMYACGMTGGQGGKVVNCHHSAMGGEACWLSGTLFASGCTFVGGVGGENFCEEGGNGGDGLFLAAGSLARLRACSEAGGVGGFSLCGCTLGFNFDCPGANGLPIAGSGTQQFLPDPHTRFFGLTMYASSAPEAIPVSGQPGLELLLSTSQSADQAWDPLFQSERMLPMPLRLPVDVGVIGAGGNTNWYLDLNAATWTGPISKLYAQGAFQAPGTSDLRLANPFTFLRLDRHAAPDCDGDGVCDYVEVYETPGSDQNHNLIPDSCPGG